MFGEKMFKLSEPFSIRTIRILLPINFFIYQAARILWKQSLIPPLAFFIISFLTEIMSIYILLRSNMKKGIKNSLVIFLIFVLLIEAFQLPNFL